MTDFKILVSWPSASTTSSSQPPMFSARVRWPYDHTSTACRAMRTWTPHSLAMCAQYLGTSGCKSPTEDMFCRKARSHSSASFWRAGTFANKRLHSSSPQEKDLGICRIGLADCSLHQLHAGQRVCVALQSLAQLRHRLHGDAAHVVAAPLAAGLQKPVDSQTPVIPRASEVLYERGVRAKANLHKLHHLADEVAPSRRWPCSVPAVPAGRAAPIAATRIMGPPLAAAIPRQAAAPRGAAAAEGAAASAPGGLSVALPPFPRHPQLAWLQPNTRGSFNWKNWSDKEMRGSRKVPASEVEPRFGYAAQQ